MTNLGRLQSANATALQESVSNILRAYILTIRFMTLYSTYYQKTENRAS